MPTLRFGLGSILLATACGTDAAGVSECREIEQARCDAASACGFPNVAECRLFYRDHCLHGLPSSSATATDADACVGQLLAAGQCAAALGDATAPSACDPVLETDGSAASVCDAIRSPELLTACGFLRGSSDEPEATAEAPAAP